jgi:Zn-dependent peptidase ImmA (M78 family)
MRELKERTLRRNMAPRYWLARNKAAELLRTGDVKKPPIPVENLANLVKAEIRYEPFAGNLSGMVQRTTDNRAIVGVNSLHPITRRRFTIAHELGHLILHRDRNFHIDESYPIGFRTDLSSEAIDDHEIEANQFAAELLMPMEFLAQDLNNLPLDIESDQLIAKLARKYQVSLQAMTIRLSSKLALR